jgi:hypothetical protein
MLAGATQRSDSDPYDRASPPITVPPHWMIMWPFDPKATGLPTTHRETGAYISGLAPRTHMSTSWGGRREISDCHRRPRKGLKKDNDLFPKGRGRPVLAHTWTISGLVVGPNELVRCASARQENNQQPTDQSRLVADSTQILKNCTRPSHGRGPSQLTLPGYQIARWHLRASEVGNH